MDPRDHFGSGDPLWYFLSFDLHFPGRLSIMNLDPAFQTVSPGKGNIQLKHR
jgi:hypothetical protein